MWFAAIQKYQARERIFQGPEFIFLHPVLGIEPETSEWFAKALSARPRRLNAHMIGQSGSRLLLETSKLDVKI